MPFRLTETTTKIQFVDHVAKKMMITKAAEATGKVSVTQYIQHAIIDALVRDLGVDRDSLLELLPPPKGPAGYLKTGTRHSQPKAKPAEVDSPA